MLLRLFLLTAVNSFSLVAIRYNQAVTVTLFLMGRPHQVHRLLQLVHLLLRLVLLPLFSQLSLGSGELAHQTLFHQ